MNNPYSESDEYKKLQAISDQFASTALKVNDASLQRREHTENAISFIEEAESAGGLLLKELRVGSKESILLRNRHDAILNICRILAINLEAQEGLLANIHVECEKNPQVLSGLYLTQIRKLNNSLKQSLTNAISLLDAIVQF
ncbi:MAG: hypothetical protein ACOCWH_06350, partial [Spirochaetota bacterium]